MGIPRLLVEAMGSHRGAILLTLPEAIRMGAIAGPLVADTTAKHDAGARERYRCCFGPTMEKRTLTRLALTLLATRRPRAV